jgi:hypothetical protein
MATHVSPGVYSKIIDLSEYLVSTPGTIGFLPIITEKGPDNVLTRISSIEEFRTKFGDPNLKTFGKYYGQGPYVALNHLEVSSDLYVMRALPDDAEYANAVVAFVLDEDRADDVDVSGSATDVENSDENAADVSTKSDIPSLAVASYKHAKNTQVLDTLFTAGGTEKVLDMFADKGAIYTGDQANKSVLMYIRGYGRGDWYNKISFLLRADSNPNNFGLYNFEIYEDQEDGPVMVESYNVSFEPESLDTDGESNFIEDVVNKFSKNVQVNLNEDALPIMRQCLKDYYLNDPGIIDTHEEYIPDGEVSLWNDTLVDDETGYEYSLVPTYFGEADLDEGHDTTGIYVGKTKWEEGAQFDADADGNITRVTYPEQALGTKAKVIWKAYVQKAYAKEMMAAANAAYETAVGMPEESVSISGSQDSRDEAIDKAIAQVEIAQIAVDKAQLAYDNAMAMSLMHLSDADAGTWGEQPYHLEEGSLGSLMVYGRDSVTGAYGKNRVQASVANQTLCMAYSGLLKKPVVVRKVDEHGNVKFKTQYANEVLDLDWIYFTIVYDAGYKPDVKQMAKELVETRMDCVLISDCGDNSDCEEVELYTGAVKGATDCRIWNSYLCARYEPYTRIYDQFNGCDVWLSPVYTMAKIIPQNDALYDIWYAPAGFNRGVSSEIKELRWSANLGERDRLYKAQVNPIVYFPEGMTVWGQLTTQKKTSTLSDLNCVRTVLYIKRAVEQFCRNYVFEFNDPVTHEAIANGIIPLLSAVQAARGLKDFSIEVGATDYEYKTKTCHVNITLSPMKVIEKIQCNFYIQ